MNDYRIAASTSSATRSPLEKHDGKAGNNRWMVWAPDKDEPERVTIGHCCPTLQQMDFAIRLSRVLNQHASEGGTWMVAWTDPNLEGVPTRMAYGWVDKDGDMPFVVDTEESMQVLTTAGVEVYASQGHDAWREYHAHVKDLEIDPPQMIRARQGEAVKDSRIILPAEAS